MDCPSSLPTLASGHPLPLPSLQIGGKGAGEGKRAGGMRRGPIERGLDCSRAGVDIYFLTVDGLGLATVAHSLAAIGQRVVNEKRLTWEELAQYLRNDWQGAEYVRLMMKNIARFGSGGSRAAYWAKRLSTNYVDMVRATATPDGWITIPGLCSHGSIHRYGAGLGATAADSISHSAEPDPGFMPDGTAAPTAKANAAAMVQPGWGNAAPLQMDIDKRPLREQGGIEALQSLIKTHNTVGGTLINLNVMSKEMLLEAHKDPSKYPDLMVRVTGYSAYFHSLSPVYRQQIVDRILASS